MKIRYARSAKNDLRNILRYGQEHWTNTAEAFVEMLRHSLESTLGNHPNAGRKGRVEGTREFVLGGSKHIVVYVPPSEANADLIVVRVLHGAQRWPGENGGK
jgi:toxin ParE1/3/4